MPDSTVSRQNPRQCPECGALLRPGALRGLCSRCLVTRALSHRDRAAREHEAMLDVQQVASAFTDLDVREMIGRGGMGAVYAAWQKSLERLVALKVLSPALLSSEDFLDRFQREARVMAQLDHPNIARVFDSGLTESGEPFIVMELIRGEPITHFAARQSLTLQQRLELFRGACAGVHHAHLKGVVHRDIKPSNVLVTDQDGRWAPKVIDFGLARSHGPAAQGGADWETLYHLLGTPAYMSPEQAGGTSASIDTRSDIYSLGALLYELLTEMPPFDEEALRGGASENLRETLVGLPIRQPSDRAAESRPVVSQEGPRETRRPVWADALRGDLDAIVLKRLAKDPSQRYQTVAALMDDLDRFTLHEPVTAMEATVAYRLRKFLRRYRLAVAGTLLVFLLLAGGSTLLFLESLQTRRAERLAAQRLKQGEDLIDFMLGDLYTKLDTLGRLDVLDSALGSVEQFYAESAGPKLAPNRLAHRAHARRLFGLVRSARGQTEVARSNYVESIQLYHAALSTQPAHSVWLEGLSQAWNNLAVSYHSVLSVGEAEAAYQQALEFNGRALALEPTTANWIDTRASILHNLAALQEATSRLNDATKNYGAALDLWNKLLAREPDNPGFLEHVGYVHQNLAFLHSRQGEIDRAAEANNEALRMRERLVRLDTNNVQWLVLLADIRQNISDFHLNQGQFAEAEAWMDLCRPVREQLARRDPANVWWQQALADAYRHQAVVLAKRDEDEAALAAHRQAWEISERLLREAKPNPIWREKWLNGLQAAEAILSRIAHREQERGNLPAARSRLNTLFDLRAKRLAENLADTTLRHGLATVCADTASLAKQQGKNAEAAVHAQLALFYLNRGEPAKVASEFPSARLQLLRELAIPRSAAANPVDGAPTAGSTHLREAVPLHAVIRALEEKTLTLPRRLADEVRQFADSTTPVP
ncbi:MAG: protein kinase [Verrucomicrobiales bacterium]|nr:protein kinase [Verrucomicrobiales bacterium]